MAIAILPLAVIAAVALAVPLFQGSDQAADRVTCAQAPPTPETIKHFSAPPPPELADRALWLATLRTNCGPIQIQLDGLAAPQTVASFIFLARHGYWHDSPCHRLTAARTGMYLLQCGDPTGTGLGTPGYSFGTENAPASHEYARGTVAMAREGGPGSNGSQFFIFYRDTALPSRAVGFSIFGNVTAGMAVVDAVADKGPEDGVQDHHPFQPISFLSVRVVKEV